MKLFAVPLMKSTAEQKIVAHWKIMHNLQRSRSLVLRYGGSPGFLLAN